MKFYEQICVSLENKYTFMPQDIIKLAEQNIIDAQDKVYNCTFNHKGYSDRPPKFKNRSKQRFTDSGQYWADYLLKEQAIHGGIFYSILIILGKRPLYSKDTKAKAKAAAGVILKDFPGYCSVERDKYRKGKIHVHILALLPATKIIPRKAGNYPVKHELLGSRPKYEHKFMRNNVQDFLSYLMKCSDARSVEKGSRTYKELLLELFFDEYEKTQGKGSDKVTLSWASNLPFAAEIKRQAAAEKALKKTFITEYKRNKRQADFRKELRRKIKAGTANRLSKDKTQTSTQSIMVHGDAIKSQGF